MAGPAEEHQDAPYTYVSGMFWSRLVLGLRGIISLPF
jgi:hypothetical protein